LNKLDFNFCRGSTRILNAVIAKKIDRYWRLREFWTHLLAKKLLTAIDFDLWSRSPKS